MSYGHLDPPVVPRNGHTAEILAVCRVSDPKPGKQDERSLTDQEASYQRWLHDRVTAPFKLTVLAGTGSGELLDREEYQKLITMVGGRRFDLVLAEDLGRIVRRIHAHLMCEHCEDHDTRLIAINDHVDTAHSNWRDASIFAAWHHERSNRDTSERIKRTHRNRFMGGGVLALPMYGWEKPPGAKTDADLRKDPRAEAVYREWFRLLDEDDATFAEVARWLRAIGVPLPQYARGDRWTGTMVGRHTYNPLLKGVRERNRRKTKRVNNPGRYLSRKAEPHELLSRNVQHLAFFEQSYYDRVIAKVKARNAIYRRADDPTTDPLRHRPKKMTRYPGRATYCGVCGRPFVWGGHGQTDHLMCSGAREHRCWNGVTFDGASAARRVTSAVLSEAERLKEFDSVLLALVTEEAALLDGKRNSKLAALKQRVTDIEREVANIVAFIRGGNTSPSLGDELRRLEDERIRVRTDLAETGYMPIHTVNVPPVDELKRLAREHLVDVADGSPEFIRAMQKLVPRIVVFPHRLCDGGAVVLRAKFRLQLANLLPDTHAADLLRRPLEKEVLIDLFDLPQRAAFRSRVVEARSTGRTEQEVAVECGLTITAAQRAAALQRQMDLLGISDPYLPVLAPPEDCPKLRRHHHSDYKFVPLSDAGHL